MKKFKFFFCVLLTTVVFWVFHNYKRFWKPKSQEVSSKMPAMVLTVSTVKPHVTSVKRYVDTVGQCTATASVTLVSKITGTLQKIKLNNGGSVKAGDVLFQFNEDTPKAVLQQAEAQLALDKAKHDLNVLQLQRSENLRSQNFVSQQEYDTYKANVAVSQAQIDMDNAVINQRRITLGDYTLSAPFDGEIGKSAVDEGSYIQAGTALATLNQLQPIYADAFLAERHLRALLHAKREEITVEAHLLDDPSVQQAGKLVFIANEVEKSTGTFDIRAEFSNENKQFWPGRGVEIKICYETVPNAMLVPESSIREGMHGSFVYVVNAKGLAEMKSVTTEQTYDGWVVVQGLNGNEQVIASGHALLAPGMPVKSVGTVEVPASLKPLAVHVLPTEKRDIASLLPFYLCANRSESTFRPLSADVASDVVGFKGRTTCNERRTANGERRTANGERRTANGERRTIIGYKRRCQGNKTNRCTMTRKIYGILFKLTHRSGTVSFLSAYRKGAFRVHGKLQSRLIHEKYLRSVY